MSDARIPFILRSYKTLANILNLLMRVLDLRVFCLLLVLLPLFGQAAYARDKLASIHKEIVADYAQVEHINADEFLAMNADELVIFDVRESKEYSVSHLEGAIRVDPDISVEDFEQKYAAKLNGKTAVFYCSVGRRSSKLAARVDDVVDQYGATAAYNLTGGVFRWRNEQRPMMSRTNQVTDKIHPYNWYWSRLIKDKKAIQYSAPR